MTHVATLLGDALRRRMGRAGAAEGAALCAPLAMLLAQHLRFDAADPLWPDRDRLVLSPALAELGQAAAGLLGAGAGLFHAPDQALGTAVGMALAERILAARFGRSLVDHRCWVLGGGAALASGHVQEAAGLAALWRLGRVTMIVQVATESSPGLSGFASHGWSVRRAGLGRMDEIEAAISAALRSARPTLIACIGVAAGVEAAETSAEDATQAWASAARRAAGARRGWLKRLARHASRPDFDHATGGRLPTGWHTRLAEPAWLAGGGPGLSTAQAVRQGVADLSTALACLVGLPGEPGWAAPSPHAQSTIFGRDEASLLARSAAACLAGIAWHGGAIPMAAHRLDQIDEVRPALADAARHGLRLVQILVEPARPCPVSGRRAALRAMRGVATFRPADAAEALECLELALRRLDGPSVLLVSEAILPVLAQRPVRTRSARGGHLAAPSAGPRHATLVASGPELHVALAARARLAARGLAVAVVSLPCWSLFAAQDAAWRADVLGTAPRIGVEAGSGFGWERWLGADGLFVSLAPDEAGDARDAAGDALFVADAVRRHLGGPQAN